MSNASGTKRIYTVRPSKQYRRDIKRLVKSGYDRSKLEAVIDVLASGKTLDQRQRDHMLLGNKAGIRECHIAPDWLLLYQQYKTELILILVRTGTHAQLFGK